MDRRTAVHRDAILAARSVYALISAHPANLMSADVPDARIEKYRLIRLLGSGGMGAVYLAHDPTLDRNVAIKFVAPERLGDAAARRRLIREARAAASLDHPAICAVHEVLTGSPDGGACIVMAYVEGETLAERLKRGPLEAREALSMTAHLADALAAAHKRGIIHRDIKPQNIMLTPSGRPKLLDFGIATVLERGPSAAQESAETHTDLAAGLPGGTPGYMSPEQVQQRGIDARSDLFALGVVLFEALTGTRPFSGRSAIEVHAQVLNHHPPPVSSLRPLSDEHDELCRRLLAKDPADRFQSAEELLGALRVFVRDTAHSTAARQEPLTAAHRPRRTLIRAGVAATLIALAVFAVWRWRRPEPLPAPTPDAQRWFITGTNNVREGAYYSGIRALGEAVTIFPEYPQAYIRMAEAYNELDRVEDAAKALLRVDARRLPSAERLRHDAIRALLIPDMNAAVQTYRQLAERDPEDAGTWLDLGRAQQHAGLQGDARESFERAISADSQYAPARLALGSVHADAGNRDEALASFAEAERLYAAASNVEGETETMLRRGSLFESFGELPQARAAFEKVLTLARENRYQYIRAQLLLSSVKVSEGQFAEAIRLADEAIKTAERNDLDQVAANGLIDLGYALTQAKQTREAELHLDRAIDLASRRGARRTEARGVLQQASLRLVEDRYADARDLAQSTLEFLRKGHYRRYELTALLILSRAHEHLGDFATARQMAENVLRLSEEAGDDAQVGAALDNLAELATIAGELPQALAHRLRLVETNRRLQDRNVLPFDLTNCAYVLIRLGRGKEAVSLLREVEEGIAQRIDAYVGRGRRVMLLKALNSSIGRDFRSASQIASDLVAVRSGKPDATLLHAIALLDHATSELGVHAAAVTANEAALEDVTAPVDVQREIAYFRLQSQLARGEARAALDGARATLAAPAWPSTSELEWRLAATAAIAARQLNDADAERELSTRARAALARLRTEWKEHARDYERRPDLMELKRRAGMK